MGHCWIENSGAGRQTVWKTDMHLNEIWRSICNKRRNGFLMATCPQRVIVWEIWNIIYSMAAIFKHPFILIAHVSRCRGSRERTCSVGLCLICIVLNCTLTTSQSTDRFLVWITLENKHYFSYICIEVSFCCDWRYVLNPTTGPNMWDPAVSTMQLKYLFSLTGFSLVGLYIEILYVDIKFQYVCVCSKVCFWKHFSRVVSFSSLWVLAVKAQPLFPVLTSYGNKK